MKFASRLKVAATLVSAGVYNMGAAAAKCRTLAQVIADGASDANAIKVGDTGVPFTVEDAAGNWEDGLYAITSSAQITRTSVLASSAGGTTPVTFSGALAAFNTASGSWLSKVFTADDGQDVASLPTVTSVPAGAFALLVGTDGALSKILASTLAGSGSGGTATPADTTAPTLSALTASATGATTATGSVTTNEANGTLYWLYSTASTATAAQVKAGSSKTVTATGAQALAGTGLIASTSYYLHALHRDAAGNDSAVLSLSASFATSAAPNIPAYQARTTNASGQKINGVNFFPDGTGTNATLQGSSPNYFTRDTNTFVSVYKTSDGSYPSLVKFVWSKSSTQPPIVYADTALPANSVNGNTLAYTDAVLEVGLLYGNTFSAASYVRGTPGTYYLWALTPDGGAAVYDNGTGTPIGWTVKAP